MGRVNEDPRYEAEDEDDWPPTPRDWDDAESAATQLRPPKREAPQRQEGESIAQMMERWAAKLSPAEQKQWQEHGTFIGWTPPPDED